MKVIIPVAGIGTRLRPHTYSVPKVLLQVAGKPMLAHILDNVRRLKPEKVVFIIGFLGDQIVQYVGKNYKFKCKFIEQKELKGLGYAINMAAPELEDNQPVLIILGDTIFDADLLPVIKGKHDSLGVKRVADPRRFGVAEKKGGFVTRLIEKPEEPTSNLAAVGIYYIKSSSVLKASLDEIVSRRIMTKGEYQLTDALQLMIDGGVKFKTFEIKGWYDCGKPETLLETNRQLLAKGKQVRRLKGSKIIAPVFVAKSARVEGCVLGPNVSVGEKAHLKNSTIENSIIGERALVENSTLDFSLVGNRARIKRASGSVNVGNSSEIVLS
ncbi:MAG: NTP transferase domain-containing protein [Candidatus Zixiibacteriota bacterium]|nr:MAG: NTP transferase domain-containing protein [candidate division Zixibacteria bacterium]